MQKKAKTTADENILGSNQKSNRQSNRRTGRQIDGIVVDAHDIVSGNCVVNFAEITAASAACDAVSADIKDTFVQDHHINTHKGSDNNADVPHRSRRGTKPAKLPDESQCQNEHKNNDEDEDEIEDENKDEDDFDIDNDKDTADKSYVFVHDHEVNVGPIVDQSLTSANASARAQSSVIRAGAEIRTVAEMAEIRTATKVKSGMRSESDPVMQAHSPSGSGSVPITATLTAFIATSSSDSVGFVGAGEATGGKRASCSFPGCGASFNRQFSLKRHMKKHDQNRSFQCPFTQCGKLFAEKSTLTRHERTHTGERPYVCQLPNCGMSFADRTNIRRHQKSHVGWKPFTCPIADCPSNDGWYWKKDFAKHVWDVHQLVIKMQKTSHSSVSDALSVSGMQSATHVQPPLPSPPTQTPVSTSG
jgi:uncharacterized C2H2 Zn-finger protein